MNNARSWKVETGDQYPATVTEEQVRAMDEEDQYDFMI